MGGIILNRVETEKCELTSQKVAGLIGSKVLGVIPEDVNVRKSAAFKIPIVIRSPKSPAAIAFKKVAATLAGEAFTEEKSAEKKEGFADRLARTLFGGKK